MMTFDDLKAKYPRLLRPTFQFECGIGWIGILDSYFEVLDREMPEGAVYSLRQVKEKLGSLRIYDSSYGETTASAKAVTDAHALAEARSYYTCEVCGKPGRWSNRDEGYVYSDDSGTWWRYDPDLDAFAETEAPKWSPPL